MGRLTLNVLLSFAQFEREVTSERIRDKVAASKKKGIWVGGPLPLGYAMENGKVTVVPEESERVRHVFGRYLELGRVRALMRDLKDRNIVSRQRHLKTGVTRGGVPFGCGASFYLLRNRFYTGEVNYKGQIYPEEQPPILDRGELRDTQPICVFVCREPRVLCPAQQSDCDLSADRDCSAERHLPNVSCKKIQHINSRVTELFCSEKFYHIPSVAPCTIHHRLIGRRPK